MACNYFCGVEFSRCAYGRMGKCNHRGSTSATELYVKPDNRIGGSNPSTHTNFMPVAIKYETTEMIKGKLVPCQLFEDGTFKVNGEIKPWYKTSLMPSAKPWIPSKRKHFVSLVRQGIRDGDYD
jgi:hypothetical protein